MHNFRDSDCQLPVHNICITLHPSARTGYHLKPLHVSHLKILDQYYKPAQNICGRNITIYILNSEAKCYNQSTKNKKLCPMCHKRYFLRVYSVRRSVTMNTCCDHVNHCDKGLINIVNNKMLKSKNYTEIGTCQHTPKNSKRILVYTPMSGYTCLLVKYYERKCKIWTINPTLMLPITTIILEICFCPKTENNLSPDSSCSGKIKRYFGNASCFWLSICTDIYKYITINLILTMCSLKLNFIWQALFYKTINTAKLNFFKYLGSIFYDIRFKTEPSISRADTQGTAPINWLPLKRDFTKLFTTLFSKKINIKGHNIFKSSIAIQKICLGVNATSTIYYSFLKLRTQNPWVLVVITKLEKLMVFKPFSTFIARIVSGDQCYVHHLLQLYLNSNKNE
jgi:hypothetical protein